MAEGFDVLAVIIGSTLGFGIIVILEIIDRLRWQRFRQQLFNEMADRGQAYMEAHPDDPFVQATNRVVERLNSRT